jgi:hypothetical protein
MLSGRVQFCSSSFFVTRSCQEGIRGRLKRRDVQVMDSRKRYTLVSQKVHTVRILVDYKREEDCQERQGSTQADLR